MCSVIGVVIGISSTFTMFNTVAITMVSPIIVTCMADRISFQLAVGLRPDAQS